MPTLIPLSQINPYIRSISCEYVCGQSTAEPFRAYNNQLFYICDGVGFLQTHDGYSLLRPGTMILVGSGAMHKIISYNGERMRFIRVRFDYTQAHRQHPDPPLYVSEQRLSSRRPLDDVVPKEMAQMQACVCANNMQALQPDLERMLMVFGSDNRYGDALLSGQFKTILSNFFAEVTAKDGGPASHGLHLVQMVFNYLDRHYMEQITNTSIAAALNYHPNYLNKQTVKYTGRSLHQHLIAYRISRATELLLFTSTPIKEIAQSTGFRSVSYFSRMFFREFGASPSRLRELYRISSEYIMHSYSAFIGLPRP